MSSSDDDVPIGMRRAPLKKEETVDVAVGVQEARHPGTDDGAGKVSAHISGNKIFDEASSEDEKPLAMKMPVKPKNGDQSLLKLNAEEDGSHVVKNVVKKSPKLAKSGGSTSRKKVQQKENRKAKSAPPATQGRERVKKVFDKPGQTRDTPSEIDPLRKFYTTLLEQVPGSEMACRWCAIHGLLPLAEAEAWVKEQAKKKDTKAPSIRRASSSSGKRGKSGKDDEDFKTSTKKKSKSTAQPPRSKATTKKPGNATNVKRSSISKKITKTSGIKTAKDTPSRRDVAFIDGGMDGSDSDDDIPLLQRKVVT